MPLLMPGGRLSWHPVLKSGNRLLVQAECKGDEATAGLDSRATARGRRMTAERWSRIGELFDDAVRLEPARREAWLRNVCGEDEELWAEVSRLLYHEPTGTGSCAARVGKRNVGSYGNLNSAKRFSSRGRVSVDRPSSGRSHERHGLPFSEGRDCHRKWSKPLSRDHFAGSFAATPTTYRLTINPGDDPLPDARRPRG